MTQLTRLFGVGVCLVALAGCTGMELTRAQKATPTGSEFSRNLYAGYLDLAEGEHEEADYKDAEFFAGRALTTAGGNAIGPQEMGSRTLPEANVGQLSDARARLMAALNATATEKAPADAAKAQVMFDCWMQEQEENFQPEDIAACKAGFDQAIAAAEAAVEPAQEAAPAAPAAAAKSWVIYFDFNKSEVSNLERIKVVEAAAYAGEIAPASIFITGHTDTAGASDYNQILSQARTASVIEEMVANGADGESISSQSGGESDLAVQTPDNTREAKNRRVEILVTPQ